MPLPSQSSTESFRRWRVATLSLALAVAVFALGYVNPSFADKTGVKHNHGGGGEDPPSVSTHTVDLTGVSAMRGTFEFDGGAADATLDSKGLTLDGDVAVTMQRATDDPTCMMGLADVKAACVDWNFFFNLCGLLGPEGEAAVTLLTDFEVLGGSWAVAQGGGRRTISFGFTITPNKSNASIDRDMSGSLTLFRACVNADIDPTCGSDPTPLFPILTGSANATKVIVTNARIHLRGKKGVTHQADCHARDHDLNSQSTIVITKK